MQIYFIQLQKNNFLIQNPKKPNQIDFLTLYYSLLPSGYCQTNEINAINHSFLK